jgi:alpha-L-rhamnosidase
MLKVAGLDDKAAEYGTASSGLKQAMMEKMWNGTAFCDGICSEVDGNSLVMSNMFTLLFGLVPQKNVPSVWDTVTSWGLEQMGDYGAFMYLGAVSGSYYAPLYDLPGDGSEILTALTKCDRYSWCSEFADNVTMTRESWHDGTYSHPWGTGAVAGVVWGLLGVHQTAPGFAAFTVQPKLGSLDHAELTVPTLRGHIQVKAKPGSVEVDVPCNTVARLCLPLSASDGVLDTPETTTLWLDGAEVAASNHGRHLCASDGVSCGAGGATRRLTSQARFTALSV